MPLRDGGPTPLAEAKLHDCESWVRREYARLDAELAPYSTAVREESGPGRKYMRRDGAGWLGRLHPKLGHIVIGFPNSLRESVRRTGLLRPQKDAAWLNYDGSISASLIEKLVQESKAAAQPS